MCVKSLFFLLLNNILLYGYTVTCLSLGSYFYYDYSCVKYLHMSLYTHVFIYLKYLRIVQLYDKCMYTFIKPRVSFIVKLISSQSWLWAYAQSSPVGSQGH